MGGLFSAFGKLLKAVPKLFRAVGRGIKKVVKKVGKAFGSAGIVGAIALAILVPYIGSYFAAAGAAGSVVSTAGPSLTAAQAAAGIAPSTVAAASTGAAVSSSSALAAAAGGATIVSQAGGSLPAIVGATNAGTAAAQAGAALAGGASIATSAGSGALAAQGASSLQVGAGSNLTNASLLTTSDTAAVTINAGTTNAQVIDLASQFGTKTGGAFNSLTEGTSTFINEFAQTASNQIGFSSSFPTINQPGFTGQFESLVSNVNAAGPEAYGVFKPSSYTWGSAASSPPTSAIDIAAKAAPTTPNAIIAPQAASASTSAIEAPSLLASPVASAPTQAVTTGSQTATATTQVGQAIGQSSAIPQYSVNVSGPPNKYIQALKGVGSKVKASYNKLVSTNLGKQAVKTGLQYGYQSLVNQDQEEIDYPTGYNNNFAADYQNVVNSLQNQRSRQGDRAQQNSFVPAQSDVIRFSNTYSIGTGANFYNWYQQQVNSLAQPGFVPPKG